MDTVLERDQWGLILAGGEGVRLRTLTRAIAGEERPKQFCAPLGGETLLEQTRRRAALVIPPARTFVTLTGRHERFYRALLAGMPRHCAVIEPESRGTAPSIRYGLAKIARHAPTGAVAVFPSDHYASDGGAFMAHVAAAFRAVRARPDLLVLLGIAPGSPETEYGWIEPGERIPGTPLCRVESYRGKPGPGRARALLENGCLWSCGIGLLVLSLHVTSSRGRSRSGGGGKRVPGTGPKGAVMLPMLRMDHPAEGDLAPETDTKPRPGYPSHP